MISYRLAPAVGYQEQVQDVARAVAWTHKNIAKYGGCPDRLFVCGHSAGGHLAALLATDAHYLKAEGLSSAVLKGVIAVSGVYRIADVSLKLDLSGHSWSAGLDEKQPAPALAGRFCWQLNPFGMVFGDDVKAHADASPVCHVQRGLPPFLIIYAGRDYPMLPAMAQEFATALRCAGCTADLLKVQDREHESVMFDARSPEDPVFQAIRAFITKPARVEAHPIGTTTAGM
jgi:acetyl esterase/lipase